ncbi:hypothetical protein [Helicobacter mustelae]|nr:hypothetical protein [Helicobacter mustelae]SQH71927.1 FlmD protein [Helicobacter mustelae]
MGHFSRCVLLVDLLKSLGVCVEFYHYDDSAKMPLAEGILPLLEGLDVAIIDSYEISSSQFLEIAHRVRRLMIIDDVARISFPPGSVILNGGIHTKELYAGHLGPVYAGLEYMIYDKTFCQNKIIAPKIQRILLCFGGSDEGNYTQRVTKILEKLEYDVIIVLGAHYVHHLSTHFEVLRNIDAKKLAWLFAEVDLAIVSGGRMVNEAILSQVPTLVLPIAKNQEHQVGIYDAMHLVQKTSLEDLAQKIPLLDFATREAMARNCARMQFGSRLKDCLLEILRG